MTFVPSKYGSEERKETTIHKYIYLYSTGTVLSAVVLYPYHLKAVLQHKTNLFFAQSS